MQAKKIKQKGLKQQTALYTNSSHHNLPESRLFDSSQTYSVLTYAVNNQPAKTYLSYT